MHVTSGRNACRNKTAVLEVSNAAQCSCPNSATIVLKQRFHGIIWQSISLTVSRNLPVLPSAQTVVRSDPNAFIHCRQHRPRDTGRRALGRRNAGNGEVAKTIEPSSGC